MGGYSVATQWSKPMAGLWLRVRFEDIKATKVKAHLTHAQAVKVGHGAHHKGNEVVDLLAKEAATLHKDLATIADKQGAFLKGLREHYRKVARLLGMWKGKQTTAKHPTAEGKPKLPLATHDLAWIPQFRVWQCQDCLKSHKNKAAFKTHGCKAFSMKHIALCKTAADLGHKFWFCRYTNEPGLLVYCSICGCYGQTKSMGLSQQCKGRTGSQRARLTKWVLNGVHPVTKAHQGKPQQAPVWLGDGAVVLPTCSQPSQSEWSQAHSRGSGRMAHKLIHRINGDLPAIDPGMEWDREWALLEAGDEEPHPAGFLGFDEASEADVGWPASPAHPG
jgi:hypothetical protein